MALGGKRPGAGRPKGVKRELKAAVEHLSKKEVKRATAVEQLQRAIEGKLSPLQVMLEAMEYVVREARRVEKLDNAIEVVGDPDGKSVTVITARSLYALASDLARKAAPFVHPTLAAVETKNTHTFETTLLDMIHEEERTRKVATH